MNETTSSQFYFSQVSVTHRLFSPVLVMASHILNFIDKLEKNLQRDFIISCGFRDIDQGILNQGRRRVIMILLLCKAFFAVKFMIATVAPEDSCLHTYSLNPLLGYGFIGRFMSAVYFCGFTGMTLHQSITFINEKRGTLHVMTDLKKMFKKLRKPSPQECSSFGYFLNALIYTRELTLWTVSVPMIVFRATGAVVTARQLNNYMFLAFMVPEFVVYIILMQYNVQIFAYVLLFIAQSTAYFKLRMNRSDKKLLKVKILVNELANSIPDGTGLVIHLPVTTIRRLNLSLIQLQSILNEIQDHNKCIKYWLRDELYVMAAFFIVFVVYLLGDIAWYFKVFPFIPLSFAAIILGISFSNAAQLFVRIRRTAVGLHSCQTLLLDETIRISRGIESGVSSIETQLNASNILKTKLQLRRMIHRVSSPFLRIGYTKGDGDSFSPACVAQFMDTIVLSAIMFINSEYNWLTALTSR